MCGQLPDGSRNSQILAAARSALTSLEHSPDILAQLADAAIAHEDNADLFRGFFLDQVKELEKEVQDRLGTSEASIPVGQEGARILYVRLSGAHTIVPQAILFNAARESWTLSLFETSNYAVFLGDSTRARRITERIMKEAERLRVKEIVLAECVHTSTAMRWEAAKWFGGPLPFRVRSILEVLDEYVREQRFAPETFPK